MEKAPFMASKTSHFTASAGQIACRGSLGQNGVVIASLSARILDSTKVVIEFLNTRILISLGDSASFRCRGVTDNANWTKVSDVNKRRYAKRSRS